MKTVVIVAVGLVILAGVATAQVFRAERLVLAPGTVISANDLQASPHAGTVRARGNVRIQVDSSVISADEADLEYVNGGDTTMQLRGNVRVRVTRAGQ